MRFRAAYYDQLESGFGKANLRAVGDGRGAGGGEELQRGQLRHRAGQPSRSRRPPQHGIPVRPAPRTFLEDFGTRIASLTPAQIEAASARYLDTYRQAIAIVGDWQKVKDQVTPFGTLTVYTPEGEIKKGVD